MQRHIFLLNKRIFERNVVMLHSNFLSNQVQEKISSKNINPSNLERSLSQRSYEFGHPYVTEDFGLFSGGADVYKSSKSFLDIPTQPRTLDFYSSLNFHNELEQQHIDLSALLDDVVHIEDVENYIENSNSKAKLTLSGERNKIFDIVKMKNLVAELDYENIVNELNTKKWPKFRNNENLLNSVIHIVVQCASECTEIKKVIIDFAKSDSLAYLNNSVAIQYYLRILKEHNIEVVIEEVNNIKDLFLLDALSTVGSKKHAKIIKNETDNHIRELINTAIDMECSFKDIEKLCKILISKKYINNLSIYFECIVSKLLDKGDLRSALHYCKRQEIECLKSTCFPYFLKYFLEINKSN